MYTRTNKLTEEVEMYHKRVGKRDDFYYIISRDTFLQTLLDVNITSTGVKYTFLNKRLNQKIFQLYNAVNDLVDIPTLFHISMELILNYCEDRDSIRILYDDNHKLMKDDISAMVFLIDKRVRSSVFELNDMVYNYKEEGPTYIKKYGNIVYLDDDNSELFTVCETVFEDTSDVDDLLTSVKLTRRQFNVIKTWHECNYNMTLTGSVLGVSKQSVSSLVDRVRKKFEDNYEVISVERRFDILLDSEDFNGDKLMKFITKHKDTDFIFDILYSMSVSDRKPIIRKLQDKLVTRHDLERSLVKFLSQYYK